MIKIVTASIGIAMILLVTNTQSFASIQKKEVAGKCYLTEKFLECSTLKSGEVK